MKTQWKKYRWVIVGIISFIVIIVSLITWFYPYSILSVNKSITYEPEKVLSNGKSYHEILKDFQKSVELDYESDSENEYPNLTIIRTQNVLHIFEQDWLIRNDPVSFNREKLDRMFGDVTRAREILLNHVAEADYSSQERKYIIDNVINNLLLMEDTITALKNDPHVTRKELNFWLDILHSSYSSVLISYIYFYDMVIPE